MLRIGGQAQAFILAHSVEDIAEVCAEYGMSFYCLGRGSNLLIKDDLIQRPVIKLADEFNYIRQDGESLEVGAATPFSVLLKYCMANDLGGLDNLAGIPASLGGMVAMNASAYGREISHYLEEAEIGCMHGLRRLKKDDINFGYRHSSLKGIVTLRMWFHLPKDTAIKERVARFMKQRLMTQELTSHNCGCVFKNPQGQSAGQMIDACGLKGLRKNGAQVSLKHANFINNLGDAGYDDVDYLIRTIKDKVHQQFGVVLEEEIERWT